MAGYLRLIKCLQLIQLYDKLKKMNPFKKIIKKWFGKMDEIDEILDTQDKINTSIRKQKKYVDNVSKLVDDMEQKLIFKNQKLLDNINNSKL